MVAVTVKPFVLKDVLLKIDADNYEAHVSQVEFTPSASTQTWTGLAGNTVTDVSTATWAATLAYAQDWETADSLSRYLYDHEGDEVAVEFTPRSGSGPKFTASLIITPGAIGGTVNGFATATVTLGMSGKPVLVPAV